MERNRDRQETSCRHRLDEHVARCTLLHSVRSSLFFTCRGMPVSGTGTLKPRTSACCGPLGVCSLSSSASSSLRRSAWSCHCHWPLWGFPPMPVFSRLQRRAHECDFSLAGRLRVVPPGAQVHKKSVWRPPTQALVPPSFFEATTKGRRPKNRASHQASPTLRTYCCWAVGLVHHWRTWLLVPDAMIVFVFLYVAIPVVVLPACWGLFSVVASVVYVSSASCPEGSRKASSIPAPREQRTRLRFQATPSRSKPLRQFGDRHHQDQNHISIFMVIIHSTAWPPRMDDTHRSPHR